MTAGATLDALRRIAILPVVVIDDADDAEPLAHALIAGGVPCAEFTLRTAAGLEAITRTASLADFVVGAGTVLDAAHVDLVVDEGATFVVSPGLDEAVVRRADERGALAVPGIASATEVMQAIRLGLSALKVFPAEALGGVRVIDALHGPFPELVFMPSGGVTVENAGRYRRDYISPVSTSWIAPRDMIRDGRFGEITRRAELFREAMNDD